MNTLFSLKVRPGHPDFLDLPWTQSIVDWSEARFVDLPRGSSRHEVRFVAYDQGIYVVKELPRAAARQDYEVLRALETQDVIAAIPVGIVEDRYPDAGAERSAAIITRYLEHAFSYQQLVRDHGFGAHREPMLDAFAGLLVELHLAGCFWGDCSLANVLYRYDAEAIEPIMVDAETSVMRKSLSDGQREEDLEIMIINVAGGMADIAAAQGLPIDEADLTLGEDIAERYRNLWRELTETKLIAPEESFKITEKIHRLNELGFDVDEVDLIPDEGGRRLRMKVKVGGRNFHSVKLHRLTGIEAMERQARQVLSDLHYYQCLTGASTATGKEVAAVRWRVGVFEPMLERLRAMPNLHDPIQGYCAVLHHRYLKSCEYGGDVGTEAAFQDWLAAGRPDYMRASHGSETTGAHAA
ncbi:MAG: DUF4032 domain-containing protein [Candidatus Competibacteraceae bacterium]|nr:DUF4032 domain-containing protein [Candidatus Competibacteraceae bacterium]